MEDVTREIVWEPVARGWGEQRVEDFLQEMRNNIVSEQ